MHAFAVVLLFAWLIFRGVKSSQDKWSRELIKRLERHSCHAGDLHKDTTLLHGLKAGTFTELGRVQDVEVCVLQCCESHGCQLALFVNNYCYGVTCKSQQHCKTAPAFGTNGGKTVTVLLQKSLTTNLTSHHDEQIANRPKSGKEATPSKTSRGLVFYPVDTEDSNDLAFSVNLRRIAKHYTDNKNVKKALRDKADEHLAELKHGHEKKDDTWNSTAKERNATLGKILSFGRSEASSAHRRHGVIPSAKTHVPSKEHLHPKEDVNDILWNPKLLKAAISSSSVAIVIVVLILLAMSRKRIQTTK